MFWPERKSDSERAEFEADTLEHLDALYANALRLTRSQAEAEDLVQETYLKAYRFYERFERGTHVKAWLFRIQFNAFVNRYRRGNKERDVLAGMRRQPEADTAIGRGALRALVDPESEALRPALARELQAAVDTLPEDQQTVLVLSDVEGLSYKEIASAVGCPIGTVMSRLHRARRALRDHLLGQADAIGLDVVASTDPAEPVSLDEYRKKERR